MSVNTTSKLKAFQYRSKSSRAVTKQALALRLCSVASVSVFAVLPDQSFVAASDEAQASALLKPDLNGEFATRRKFAWRILPLIILANNGATSGLNLYAFEFHLPIKIL